MSVFFGLKEESQFEEDLLVEVIWNRASIPFYTVKAALM
jgi:hypothetical protein